MARGMKHSDARSLHHSLVEGLQTCVFIQASEALILNPARRRAQAFAFYFSPAPFAFDPNLRSQQGAHRTWKDETSQEQTSLQLIQPMKQIY